MSKFMRGVAVLSALALLAGACGDDDDDADDAAATTTTESEGGADGGAQAVTITAVDYGFSEVPEELTAGVVELTFQNEGEVAHEAGFVSLGDTPLEQFIEDFPAVLEGGPFPPYAETVAAPVEIPGGESVEKTFTITEGRYALFCALEGDADAAAESEGEGESTSTTAEEGGAEEGGEAVEDEPQGPSSEGEGGSAEEEQEEPTGPPHFERGMIQEIEVGAGEADATLPEADGSISAFDYGFDVDIQAGDTAINFVNDGPEQVHFAEVLPYGEIDAAAAEEAFAQLLQSEEEGPPPEGIPMPDEEGGGFSGIFSAGLGATFELNEGASFESGQTYVLACFIQDRSGGPPHAIANQMYTAFTVE